MYQGTELLQALEVLDPRDFDPDVQDEFMQARADIRLFAAIPGYGRDVKQILKALSSLLDKYRGEGSHRVRRSFAFISDAKLREIIERDYSELSRILYPAGAWKSTVIMAGSVVEAILYDLMTADSAKQAKAMASGKAPKVKGGTKDIMDGDWKLHNLIEVATDIGLLPVDSEETFDRLLRDYRNFVHPKVEIRAGYPCGEPQAMMAKGALDAICDHLTRKP
jgi:hypothetical protein